MTDDKPFDLSPLYAEIKKREAMITERQRDIVNLESYIEGVYMAINILEAKPVKEQ